MRMAVAKRGMITFHDQRAAIGIVDPQVQQLLQNLLAEHDAQLRAKDTLIAQREHEAAFKQAVIDKLTHEMAVLKRLKFAATSERFASTLAPEQRSLLEETLDSDLADLSRRLTKLGLDNKSADDDKKKAKRRALAATPTTP
jgi:transposase